MTLHHLAEAIAQAGLCELLIQCNTTSRMLAQVQCQHDWVDAGTWQRLCTRCGVVVVRDAVSYRYC